MKVKVQNLREGDVFLDEQNNAITIHRIENVYIELATSEGWMQFTKDETLDIVRRAPKADK